MHRQLLQLVPIIQECYINEEKMKICEKHQTFKAIGKKNYMKIHSVEKSIQTVSQQGIEGTNTMVNLGVGEHLYF